MADKTISGAGEHGAVADTDRLPASKAPFTPGTDGYHQAGAFLRKAAQTLTAPQRAQVRANIKAVGYEAEDSTPSAMDHALAQTNIGLAKGADIATASTIDLDAATGAWGDLTGTTTVTAVTLGEGKRRTMRAAGAFTLEAGAGLIVNGSESADHTTTAGEWIEFFGYSAGVVRAAVGIQPGKARTLDAAQQAQERANIGADLLLMGAREANVVVNPAFLSSLENGSNSVATSGAYPACQWIHEKNGVTGTCTSQRAAGAKSGLPYKITMSAPAETTDAGDYHRLRQPVEGRRMAALGWNASGGQPATFVVLLNENLPRDKSLAIVRQDGNQAYAHLLESGSALHTFVVEPPAGNAAWKIDSTKACDIIIGHRVGSTNIVTANDTWEATGKFGAVGHDNDTSAEAIYPVAIVMLPGRWTLTESMMQLLIRDAIREEEICQRYFPTWPAVGSVSRFSGGQATSTTAAAIILPFPVPPRAAPSSISISAAGDFALFDGATVREVTGLTLGASATNNTFLGLVVTVASGLTQKEFQTLQADSTTAAKISANCRLA